jgi:ribose-phosphate pyrophosphokinase
VLERGAKEVLATCVHPLLSGPAIDRLRNSPIKELVTTDTIPIPPEKWLDCFTVLSVAPMLAQTIDRIHTGGSVGAIFEANKQGILDNS